MMQKKTKPPTKSNAKWSDVHVIGGDPCMCRLMSQSIIYDIGPESTRRFDKNDNVKALKNALTAFSFNEIADAIVMTNPTAEQLKAAQEAVESGILTASALIIVTPDGTLDGRTSFSIQATKNKRVIFCPYILAGERSDLRKHLVDWQEGTEVKIDSDALIWLLDNSPTLLTKVKAQGGKRDQEVYNLEWLESELDKILAIKKAEGGSIHLDDVVSVCEFDQANDVWSFIASCTTGDEYLIMRHLDKITLDKSGISTIWLLLSQIQFLMGVRNAMDLRITSESAVCNFLESIDYSHKYLDDSWHELSDENKAASIINPYRVRKAIETCASLTSEFLSKQYQMTMNVIMDLRMNLPEEIAAPYYALALAGKIDYEEPLRPMIV